MRTFKHEKAEIPSTIHKSERKRLGINPTLAHVSLQSLTGFLTGIFLFAMGIFMIVTPYFYLFSSILLTTVLTVAGSFSFILGVFWIYHSLTSKDSIQKLTRDAVHRVVRDQN